MIRNDESILPTLFTGFFMKHARCSSSDTIFRKPVRRKLFWGPEGTGDKQKDLQRPVPLLVRDLPLQNKTAEQLLLDARLLKNEVKRNRVE
jgi:hypothetical protein